MAMKHLFPIFLFAILVLPACGEKKPEPQLPQRPEMTGEPAKDLLLLLPRGPVTVERMDGITRNARMSQLYNRYQDGLRNHYDWYVEYLETHTERPLPYHEYFALGPEEYDEMNALIQKVRYYSTGLQQLTIREHNGGIRFTGEKKLEAFESVAFDPRTLNAYIGKYTLQLTDTVVETTDQNLFGTAWKGYTWRYENPENLHLEAMKDVPKLNVIQYKLTLGQLGNSKRTLLHLQCIEIQEGFKLVDVDLPVVF